MSARRRRFRTAIILLGALAALGACAGDPRRFYKDNTTQQDYDRDAFDCERDARQVERSFGYGYDRSQAAFGYLVRCMVAKGYVYQ